MRHVTRSPDTIITTVITPIAIMLMFVYMFGGAIDTGTVSYVTAGASRIRALPTISLLACTDDFAGTGSPARRGAEGAARRTAAS
jgi:hypothetical protein